MMRTAHGQALRVLTWSGPALMVIQFVAMVSIGLVPPPKPSASADEIASIFRDNPNGVRIACVFMMLGLTFWGTFGGVVTALIRRMETGVPGLSYASVACVGAGIVFFELIPIPWAIAAYRANELDSDTLRLLNDFSWYFFLFSVPSFTCWWLMVAVAIFLDKSTTPIYPRWVAYMNIWIAVVSTPSVIIAMFKNGPFAWDGIALFWLPLGVFTVWFCSMTVMTLRAISRLEQERDVEQLSVADGSEQAAPASSVAHRSRQVEQLS